MQQHLAGTGAPDLAPDADMILIARTLGPAELLDYPRERLRGLVLEEGSPTSHVVIIARAFDIPVVGRVPRAHSILEAMDPVIVDGDRGVVYVRPGDDVRQRISESIEARARQRAVVERIERETGVAVRDFQHHPALPGRYYFDVSHLTVHEGQPLFSTLLADDWATRYWPSDRENQ